MICVRVLRQLIVPKNEEDEVLYVSHPTGVEVEDSFEGPDQPIFKPDTAETDGDDNKSASKPSAPVDCEEEKTSVIVILIPSKMAGKEELFRDRTTNLAKLAR
jgi:hypothetical protein